jgi:hypothetical protein
MLIEADLVGWLGTVRHLSDLGMVCLNYIATSRALFAEDFHRVQID